MKRNIGIDFGTSSTVMFVKDFKDDGIEGQLKEVKIKGNSIIPTIAFVINDDFSQEENFIFGQDAVFCQGNGEKYINFKLLLVSDDDEKRKKAELLTLYFFKWLYKNYSEQKLFFDICDMENTFISYPVKWSNSLKERMISIAKNAGFPNVKGQNEASAAIQGLLFSNLDVLQRFGVLKKDENLKVLLLDMGAGTTDVVIGDFDTSTKQLDVFFTYPNAEDDVFFGGKEFDEEICNVVCECLDIDVDTLGLDKVGLLSDCKTWKEYTLSPNLQKNIVIKDKPAFVAALLCGIPGISTQFPVISRELFENQFEQHIKTFTYIINKSISDAIGITNKIHSKEDIDLVVLTGGHSQWYFVRSLLLGEKMSKQFDDISFPKIKRNPEKLLQLPRPSETVALGLLHGDVDFDVKATAQNNVWFQATVGDTELPPLLLIRKNEILPFYDGRIVYIEDERITQLVLLSHDFDYDLFFKLKVIIGPDSINSATVFETKFRTPCNSPQVRLNYRVHQLGAMTRNSGYHKIEDCVTIALKVSVSEQENVQVQALALSDRHSDKTTVINANINE